MKALHVGPTAQAAYPRYRPCLDSCGVDQRLNLFASGPFARYELDLPAARIDGSSHTFAILSDVAPRERGGPTSARTRHERDGIADAVPSTGNMSVSAGPSIPVILAPSWLRIASPLP
jgi:hypothetical protein